nr:unnamed protein product [Spirometra erinaceieuropaei]
MAQLRPTPTRLTSKRVLVHEDLKSSLFVFGRHDAVRKSLCSPYDGPYKVIQRRDKYYDIQKADRTDTVSIGRLKPAYLECIPPSVVPPTSSAPSSPDPPVSVPSTQPSHSTTPPTHPDFPTTALSTSSRSDFPGHHVDQHGITPLLEKVHSILSFPASKTLTQLRCFIGLLNYYRRFIPHCAATLAPLTDLLKSKAKPIELPPSAHSAFEAAKKALADATLLHHLSSDPHAQLILTTDASNSAVGAVLHQQGNNQSRPLAFFSQKLQPAKTRYSTFFRELLTICLAIRHFRHLLEGRDFSVHTDHKPLTYALKAKPDGYSPRKVRHLDYISQFTADIRYVRGSDNVVADALSRPDINTFTTDFDLAKLADLQSGDKSIDDLRSTTALQLRDAPLPASPGTILCDWSTATPRPVVPLSYRKTVFDHLHSL